MQKIQLLGSAEEPPNAWQLISIHHVGTEKVHHVHHVPYPVPLRHCPRSGAQILIALQSPVIVPSNPRAAPVSWPCFRDWSPPADRDSSPVPRHRAIEPSRRPVSCPCFRYWPPPADRDSSPVPCYGAMEPSRRPSVLSVFSGLAATC